jgi:hypothetical protein
MEEGMKLTWKKAVIAISAFACAMLLSVGWSGQSGLSLSVNKAEAHRLYIGPRFAASSRYVHSEGLPWYAVRAYYWGGPWSGPYFSWAGWSDYATRNGIGCRPGTIVKGGDGIWYNCQ